MAKEDKVDVLMVGAGPSGLMAAQALARLGVKTRIVDRRGKGTIYGNADGLQPRTLEVFESYRFIQEVLESSARLNALVIYSSTDSGIVRRPPTVNVKVETRYPYEATCSIRTIEGVLEREAAKSGLHVEYETIPTEAILAGDEGDEYPVKVDLGIGGNGKGEFKEKETVRAKYLIGSDGANSWVREKFRIPMEGEKTQYIWGVIQGHFKTTLPDWRCKCIIQHPMGSIIVIPREDNLVRIYCQLSESDVVRTPDGRIDMSKEMRIKNEEKVAKRIKGIFQPYEIDYGTIEWSTVFSVAQMVARSYQISSRILLIGDACHLHSPNAGQGANASMADGHNIAWKIAHVLRGWASPALLTTYETERQSYARELIEFDKNLARMMNEGNASQYDEMSAQQNLNTSGVGLHYTSILTHPSPPTLAQSTRLQPGYRFPPGPITRLADWQSMDLQDLTPSDGKWKLILFLSPDAVISSLALALNEGDWKTWKDRRSLVVNLVIDAVPEDGTVNWMDLPDAFRDWERVFVSTPAPALRYQSSQSSPSSPVANIFAKYGIDSSPGLLVLVRPDGHMSIVLSLNEEALHTAHQFLQDL